MTQARSATLLRDVLAERILVLDGAMGTAIQELELDAADFGGPELEGCNEHLVLTRPDAILDIHRAYLAAGADIIETNTFGGTPLVLAEYGLEAQAGAVNRRAAELACQAVAECTSGGQPRFVAGSIGPTTKALTVTGGITFDALAEHFCVQAVGLLEGGVDVLLVETCQDTRNIKAALVGIEGACARTGRSVPLMVSGTIEPTGTMLAGQTIEALYTSLMHVDLLALGLNCATGPEFMTDHLRALAAVARCRTSCVPNAGLPDSDGRYLETPASMAQVVERFVDHGWLNLVGGCCGTTSAHVEALAAMVRGKPPRQVVAHQRTLVSGIDFLELTEDNRPVLVGERTNVIGSRKFKRLIAAGRVDEASEIARRQVKGGAQVIDVCLANPDRDELTDTEAFLERVIRKVKVPLMIDSTDAAVIERALTYSQGKAIINSINLEDGEARFGQVAPLGRRFGAAFVVGTIDEDPEAGMAVTRERKLEIAERSYRLLTARYGVPGEDIIWDPLTFPCGTGDQKYTGSAVETIEGIRLIKAAFPETKTILGISNVSFGLPPAGREVLNSVFLYHATKAGLDMAIVNTEKLERYASIATEERQLAEDLLWNRGADPVGEFAHHFRDATSRVTADTSTMTLDERLAHAVVEGSQDGLIDDVEAKRRDTSPLQIINGPLMAGMDEVGRLFNQNELIVAEVLESAEVMKAAVQHLERFMEKSAVQTRGKVLLATVKGDVHDIGKNLVEIVVGNNGYEVINLGIKVPPEVLIRKVREHNPDIIGLSGLLVKSAQMMVTTAEDLATAGITVPILVGGAALTRKFTRTRIAPVYGGTVLYAKDAMDGLELTGRLLDPGAAGRLERQIGEEEREYGVTRCAGTGVQASQAMTTSAEATSGGTAGDGAGAGARTNSQPAGRSPAVRTDVMPPPVPDLERHTLEVTGSGLDDIWRFLSPNMLYGRHLGLRGDFNQLVAAGDKRALELKAAVESIQAECRAGAMQVGVVWQFFAAEGDDRSLSVFDTVGAKAEVFELPRQTAPPGLCLADYVLPVHGGERDHIGAFVVTAGAGIRGLVEEAKARGKYLRSHCLAALALETAEAAAEWLHARLRTAWGFPDPPDMSLKDKLRARYRGKRYSFGYPACPDLADQARLFRLLKPAEIGVELTDGWMMEPEASVSALVFHHPDATYFSVGTADSVVAASL